jgi:hypothetical protein
MYQIYMKNAMHTVSTKSDAFNTADVPPVNVRSMSCVEFVSEVGIVVYICLIIKNHHQ